MKQIKETARATNLTKTGVGGSISIGPTCRPFPDPRKALMRRLLPALGLLLIGCVSSPATSDTGPGTETPMDAPEVFSIGDRMGAGTVSNVQPGVDRISLGIAASPDAVWEALVQVYGDLGIEIAGANPSKRQPTQSNALRAVCPPIERFLLGSRRVTAGPPRACCCRRSARRGS